MTIENICDSDIIMNIKPQFDLISWGAILTLNLT